MMYVVYVVCEMVSVWGRSVCQGESTVNITVTKDGEIVTDKVIRLQNDAYYIQKQNIFANENFIINVGEGQTADNKSVIIESLLLEVSLQQYNKGMFIIDLPNSNVSIKKSTIKSNNIKINTNTTILELAAIDYSLMYIYSKYMLVLNLSETYNVREHCSMYTTKFATDILFSDSKIINCSSRDSFKPFYTMGELLLDSYSDVQKSHTGIQVLMSDVMIIEKTTVKGNTVILSNDVTIQKESTISTYNSGCSFTGDIIGSPSLFVSHSFNCGLNAGSFGGRGGVGISDNEKDTQECIKNGYSRMSVYGEPLLATGSGSPGSPFTIQDKSGISPGAVLIISNNLTLDKDSRIQAGYLMDGYDGSPASSGGSISLVSRSINALGKISANGQSTNKDTGGEGSGGRISLYKTCWHTEKSTDGQYIDGYNFSSNIFEVNAGQRPDSPDGSPVKAVRQKYKKEINAMEGSKTI
jgi:hypothetical protein